MDTPANSQHYLKLSETEIGYLWATTTINQDRRNAAAELRKEATVLLAEAERLEAAGRRGVEQAIKTIGAAQDPKIEIPRSAEVVFEGDRVVGIKWPKEPVKP